MRRSFPRQREEVEKRDLFGENYDSRRVAIEDDLRVMIPWKKRSGIYVAVSLPRVVNERTSALCAPVYFSNNPRPRLLDSLISLAHSFRSSPVNLHFSDDRWNSKKEKKKKKKRARTSLTASRLQSQRRLRQTSRRSIECIIQISWYE